MGQEGFEALQEQSSRRVRLIRAADRGPTPVGIGETTKAGPKSCIALACCNQSQLVDRGIKLALPNARKAERF